MLKVSSDFLSKSDSGNIGLLTLLDMSSAFDTIDHHTLVKRLQFLKEEFSAGFLPTLLDALKQSGHLPHSPRAKSYRVAFLKDLHWDPSFSQSTLLIWLVWSPNMTCFRTCMLKTCRFMGFCLPTNSQNLQSKMAACISDVETIE